MAVNNLKKKFVGNDQIDGDKILLEQGQSIKAKDASNVEQDLLKFGPAGEVLVGSANDEVAIKDESVQKSGDTMSAPLVVDESSGVTSSVSATSVVISDATGDNQVQVAYGSGLQVNSTDNTTISTSGNYYDGGLEIEVSSIDQSNHDGSVIIDTAQGIQISKTDYTQQTVGSVGLSSNSLALSHDDQNAGSIGTASYGAFGLQVQVDEGAGQSNFQVLPNQPVDNAAADGSAPAPTLDTHLTSKKYVDDADQNLQDQIDAISGGGSGSLSALQSELDDTQVGAGLETDGSYIANGSANFISSATSLKSADELLDLALKLAQDEIDAIEVGAGLDSSGQYAPNGGSNYLQSAVSLFDADIKLDAQIKANADDIADLVSEDSSFLKLDGTRSMEADLSMTDGVNHYRVVGLADPVDARDAVNKQYVDAIAEGLHVHAPVKVLVNEPLSGVVTYDNGSSGQGATLTLGTAITSIDGYSLQNGDRIIINGEVNQAHNGIYTWATGGTVLTRAEDFNSIVEAAGGDFVFVQEGTTYGNTGWVMTETTSAIGTSPIIFLQFSGAGSYTAGDALSLTGTEFDVLFDNSTIGLNGSNQLYVPMGGIGSSELANDSVTNDKIADNAVAEAQIASSVAGFAMEKGPSGKLDVKVDGTRIGIDGSNQLYIPMSGVNTSELADDSVTNDKIADNAVAEAQVASSVAGFAMEKGPSGKLDVKVDGTRIGIDGSNQLYIPMSGVNTSELADDSVTNDKIADNAVAEAQIASSVAGDAMEKDPGTGKLDVKVDGTRIGIDGSNQLYIPMSGVNTSELADDSVTNDKIADNAVAEAQIASSVAGDGLEKDPGTGKLQVKLDGASLAVSASGLKSNIVWDKAYFDLTATDISNGYVELPVIAEAGSIIGFVDRLAIHEDQDFTVSEVGGKSRITFTGDLIPPGGSSPLDEDDSLFFKFQKKSV